MAPPQHAPYGGWGPLARRGSLGSRRDVHPHDHRARRRAIPIGSRSPATANGSAIATCTATPRASAAASSAAAGCAPRAPPTAETGGVPIVAVSLARAIDVARFIAGVTSFRAIVAVLDPLWPLAHRLETIRRVDPALVITDDAGFEAALGGCEPWRGTAVSLERFEARRRGRADLGRAGGAAARRAVPAAVHVRHDRPAEGLPALARQLGLQRAVSRGPLFGAEDGIATIAPGPVSYSLTLYALVEVLATGGSLHLQSRFDAVDAVRTIEREGVERFVGRAVDAPGARRGGARRRSARLAALGGHGRREPEPVDPRALPGRCPASARAQLLRRERDRLHRLQRRRRRHAPHPLRRARDGGARRRRRRAARRRDRHPAHPRRIGRRALPLGDERRAASRGRMGSRASTTWPPSSTGRSCWPAARATWR